MIDIISIFIIELKTINIKFLIKSNILVFNHVVLYIYYIINVS